MKKIKLKVKFISILISLILLAGLFTYIFKIGNKTPSLSELIDERLLAYTTDLEDSIVSIKEDGDVVQYLCNWADSKGINCEVLNGTAVIFRISDSKSESDNTTDKDYVVVCEYDSKNMLDYVEQISTSLTIAKSVSKGSPLKIIFAPRINSIQDGFLKTSKDVFTSNSQIICLGKSPKNNISISTGGWNFQKISKGIKFVKPQFTKAYKISISGLPELKFTEDTVLQPNPIKTLGNLLAHFMSNQKLCELADISGIGTQNQTVGSASATIVFNEESQDSFNEELDSFIESFVKKYMESYPNLLFNYEEVDCPEKVVSAEDYEKIVGFLYSVTDGVCQRDSDGQILSMLNIDSVKFDTTTFSIDISTYGCSQESLDELTESNSTFAMLIGLTFDQKICAPVYDGNIISDSLVEMLRNSSKEYGPKLNFSTKSTSNTTPCSYIFETHGNLPMVYVSFNDDGRDLLCKKIVTLVSSSATNSDDNIN